ncbi:MAG: hypothetical protein FWC55_07160 [Firmicutes bacterium]|nr:hypothetical protein [Bacillota bacterium]
MSDFRPNYKNLEAAARNREVKRTPLYEHIVAVSVMEAITGARFGGLYNGGAADLREYFRHYFGFFKDFGYDAAPFEICIGSVLPGGGALGNQRMDPAVKTKADFDRYPWDEIPKMYFDASARYFEALAAAAPEGMKAVGGVGNGVFEIVQDLTGYERLCYIRGDDPELYAALFGKVGEVMKSIWKEFLPRFGRAFCVVRFGDDLGFRSSTLLPPDDLREHVFPVYKDVAALAHSFGKPFLLHSCGCIGGVFDDIIAAGIDAKHSNEDAIMPFTEWVSRYGGRIGNFGGIDTDALCRLDRPQMKEYITEILDKCKGRGGIAFGCGNSIPDYVPPENYLNMIEIVREYRNDAN